MKPLLRDLAEKQKWRCCYCERYFSKRGNRVPTLEHRKSKSMGGAGFDNLAASCLECNQTKGSLDEDVFMAVRGDPEALQKARRQRQDVVRKRRKSAFSFSMQPNPKAFWLRGDDE